MSIWVRGYRHPRYRLPERVAALREASAKPTPLMDGAIAAAPAQAAPGDRNYIENTGTIGLGVIHIFDGDYTRGNYDVILQPGDRSDQAFPWSQTQGYYIGPGYCVRIWAKYPGDVRWARNPDKCSTGRPIPIVTDHQFRIQPY
jgi:hypothetical protein